MLPDDDNDEEEEGLLPLGSDDDDDDDFGDDLEAISRACTLTGILPTDLQPKSDIDMPEYDLSSDSDSDSDDDEDDLELLRGTDQRFTESQSLLTRPLMMLAPDTFSDDNDDDDDDIILRGFEDRYNSYINGFSQKGVASNTENHFANLGSPCSAQPPEFELQHQPENQDSVVDDDDDEDDDVIRQIPNSRFPNSALMLMKALKKNREYQQFIRSKLVQITSKIEENSKLMERVKILKDYQRACKRRVGLQLSQKKDPRTLLISAKKPPSNPGKKSSPALFNGPEQNPHVASYKSVMDQYLPESLNRTKWVEKENKCLEDGIKQQLQEQFFVKAIDRVKNNGTTESIDTVFASIKQMEITPVMVRSYLPKVNWENLAKMYLNRRSGEECEARWLNFEDKLINHSPWDNIEDKKLLSIVIERGVEKWIDIAKALGTNRTPSQCLIRYQRSLNKCILRSEWTEEEDKHLCAAVEEHGESNWQAVASAIDGRTGTQCSNRWLKGLNLARTKVGRWGPDEDKRLTVAVMLFGAKNWPKIAEFVTGRTQVQCRERWSNSLDPKVKMMIRWSEEEDSKLIVAVEEYAQSCRSGSDSVKDKIKWSKVAETIPGRTDNMCRRRAMVLFPNLRMFLHETRVAQQRFGITNFVHRQEERPALVVADYVPLALMNSAFEPQNVQPSKKQKRTSRSKKKKKAAMGDESCSDEELLLADGSELKKRVLRSRAKKEGSNASEERRKEECRSSERIRDLIKKKKKPVMGEQSCSEEEEADGGELSGKDAIPQKKRVLRPREKKKRNEGSNASDEPVQDVTKKKKNKAGSDSAEPNEELMEEDCDSSELIRDLVKKKKKQGSKNVVDPSKKRKNISGSKNGGRPCKGKTKEASCKDIKDMGKSSSSFGRQIKRPRRAEEKDVTPSSTGDAMKKKKGRKSKQCSKKEEEALSRKKDASLYKQWMKSLSLS